jgi:hypothetical protein
LDKNTSTEPISIQALFGCLLEIRRRPDGAIQPSPIYAPLEKLLTKDELESFSRREDRAEMGEVLRAV